MKRRIIALLALMMLALNACALRNPAAVYCDSLGYNYTVERTQDGDIGYCRMPDGRTVEAWSFIQGKVARNYTYCARQGLTLKVTNDTKKCGRLMTSTCAVCVKDGGEVEVTELMGLTFAETTCGDGHCSFPENNQTCPKDCNIVYINDKPCNSVSDGTCEQDCGPNTDPDCEVAAPQNNPKPPSCIPLLTFPIALAFSAVAARFKP